MAVERAAQVENDRLSDDVAQIRAQHADQRAQRHQRDHQQHELVERPAIVRGDGVVEHLPDDQRRAESDGGGDGDRGEVAGHDRGVWTQQPGGAPDRWPGWAAGTGVPLAAALSGVEEGHRLAAFS
jgi:hypothetical protein